MLDQKRDIASLKWTFVIIAMLLLLLCFINYTQRNFEFFFYNVMMGAMMGFVYFYHKRIRLPMFIILGLFVMIFLNMLGGNIHISGVSLWDFKFGIMRYDNYVHAFGSFITVFAVYNLLTNKISNSLKKKYFYFALLLILITLGIGSIWETIEFGQVTFVKNTTVGDYANNALDLFFNLIGAIIGSIVIVAQKKRF